MTGEKTQGKGREGGTELCLALLSGSPFPTEKCVSKDTEAGVGAAQGNPVGIHT